MGIPKFYRWISERYPCLSQVVQENEVPVFDRLYLDMNGIIHNCSHPNDDNGQFRITEEVIFQGIVDYIETLFRIIRPRELFYMAVDGCAPRAKMNQQRARRFRSARDAQEALDKARREGKDVADANERFDSNCITPGTPFMARLQKHLEYFVQRKLSTDPLWKDVRIVLSGNEVPGEGEHKIMDFIRAEKLRPDYNPHTRHCMYGLDADLIILGLVSHEPHFSLLREEVVYGNRSSGATSRLRSAEETTFHLLSLSLYREYINLEFMELTERGLSYPYSFERVLDDWVLLSFLIGNDFMPHLPYFHINEDILPILFSTLKETLLECDDYITGNGIINMGRLEVLLSKLSKVDSTAFDEIHGGIKWLEAKRGGDGGGGKKKKKKAKGGKAKTAVIQDDIFGGLALAEDQYSVDGGGGGGDGSDSGGEDAAEVEAKEIYEAEWLMHKANYYREKMHVEVYDEAFRLQQARTYVTGLQWVYTYYYHGVGSWSWYYPSHYAPFCSDVHGIADFVPQYEMGRPFLPFEQLMAVLPPGSMQHVPSAYHDLMVSPQSPIIDFYPLDFATDLNGKKADWEALVLIPFIDEVRLLEAMATRTAFLQADEAARNRHSKPIHAVRGEKVLGRMRSSLPGVWPDLYESRAVMEDMRFPHTDTTDAHIIGLLPSYSTDIYFPGFPTFRHIPHRSQMRNLAVKVFNFPSKHPSRVVALLPPATAAAEAQVSAKSPEMLALVGKVSLVRYPHLAEGRVVSVSSLEGKWTLSGKRGTPSSSKAPVWVQHSAAEASSWKKVAGALREDFLHKRGVDTGPVHVIVTANLAAGTKTRMDDKGNFRTERLWSHQSLSYALQAVVLDAKNVWRDPLSASVMTLAERYPVGTEVVFTGQPYYGARGKVTAVDMGRKRVSVELSKAKLPDLRKALSGPQSVKYMPAHQAARLIGMSGHLISRFTSAIFVLDGTPHNRGRGKIDIGLHMKSARQGLEMPGYTTKSSDGQWLVSTLVVDILRQIKTAFPALVSGLETYKRDADFFTDTLLGNGQSAKPATEALRKFIKQLPHNQVEQVPHGSKLLPAATIARIEEVLDRAELAPVVSTLPTAHPKHLILASDSAVPADGTATFVLGDRIVCVKESGRIPWGALGNVIGVIGSGADTQIDVLFDEWQSKGTTLGGRCSSGRGFRMALNWVVNITHGVRQSGGAPEWAALGPPKPKPKAAVAPADSSSSPAVATDAAAAAVAVAVATVPPTAHVPGSGGMGLGQLLPSAAAPAALSSDAAKLMSLLRGAGSAAAPQPTQTITAAIPASQTVPPARVAPDAPTVMPTFGKKAAAAKVAKATKAAAPAPAPVPAPLAAFPLSASPAVVADTNDGFRGRARRAERIAMAVPPPSADNLDEFVEFWDELMNSCAAETARKREEAIKATAVSKRQRKKKKAGQVKPVA